MQFYKTMAALLVTASVLTVSAQETSQEKTRETLKKQEAQADSMINKYGQDLDSLVPESYKKKDKGVNHTTESFIDKQANQFEAIEKRLNEKGMLDGINEQGDAEYIKQELPKGFMRDQKAKLDSYVNELNEKGMLDGFDEKTLAERTQKYQDAAQLIANQSNTGMMASLRDELGLNMAVEANPDFDPNKAVEPESIKAIFVSFNMRSTDLEKMLEIADSRTVL